VRRILAFDDEQPVWADLLPRLKATAEPSAGGTCPRVSLKAIAKAAASFAERTAIQRALIHTQGNRRQAAQHLQISYRTLHYKMQELGLPGSIQSRW
jgi:two-component system response regulator AtoC